MSETFKKVNTSSFNNPMETFPGLTINDLNRYLPAMQTIKDVQDGCAEYERRYVFGKLFGWFTKIT